MASAFTRVLLAFVGLILVFLLIGTFLPRGYDVQNTIVVDAPAKEVFPFVNNLNSWSEWSPFFANSEDVKITFGPKTIGEGASQNWTEPRGQGKLWISRSELNRLVEYNVQAVRFPEMTSQLKLEDGGDSTRVSWTAQGSLPGGPFYGWTAMLFEGQYGWLQDQGLQRLKRLVETGSAELPNESE